MKWLNTYNNILFAAIGTLSIIIVVFVALTSLNLFSGSTPDNRGIDQEPVVDDEVNITKEKEYIKYLLGEPEIVDTTMSKYIIAVYKPEAQETTGKFSSSSYRSGLTINLIIHDFQNNRYKKLFNSIVLINYYEIIGTPEKLYLQVVYSDEDTNDNNIIDFDDQKSIGLYDIMDESYNTIPLNNKYNSITSFYDKKLNALIIIGENFLLNKQPTYQYYKYSLETQKVLELDNPM